MLISRRRAGYLILGGVGFGISACGQSVSPDQSVSLYGAGATFPAPLYQRWFAEYNKLFPQVEISYQSIGSAAGVSQFIARTVDFGASDLAMTPAELEQVPETVLLPISAGSIVLAYNLPGLTNLRLSRRVYGDIFLGKITRWNDPAIAALNLGVQLPDAEIIVIYRADGSGTTGLFTKHLSTINPQWQNQVGEGVSVKFPVGSGAKGNEGVTAQVLQTPMAIAYVEYVYAKQSNLNTALLENKSGQYVQATTATVTQAIASINLGENLIAFAPDPEGENVYPIASYSWILAYGKYENPIQAQTLRQVFSWAITDGQKYNDELGYVSLPVGVVDRIKTAIAKIN